MNHPVHDELKYFFHSKSGITILSLWLLALGLILWVFTGYCNIPFGDFASLRTFFESASVLLIVVVPCVTMKIRLQCMALRKFQAVWSVLALAIVPTIVYAVSLNIISRDGIDAGMIACGYIGLLLVAATFSAVDIFCASSVKNKFVACLIGIVSNAIIYYGFDYISAMLTGNLHGGFALLGIFNHYSALVRGVVLYGDILYFISVTFLFLWLALLSNNNNKVKLWRDLAFIAMLVIVNILSNIYICPWDVTTDKRNTLRPQTCRLIRNLKYPLQVDLYLNGNLNPTFGKIRNVAVDLLNEMALYSPHGIILNEKSHPESFNDVQDIRQLADMGIEGMQEDETNTHGYKQQLVFPEADIIYNGDTVSVNLFSQDSNLHSDKSLSASVDNIEYAFADALHFVTERSPQYIAFIEGHDELSDMYVYDAMSRLNKYYQIDRGALTGDPNIMAQYKVIIVPGSRKSFSESDKYVLDQYLMQGGSILWLIDGVKIDEKLFKVKGESPTVRNDLNIDGMLSTYGVRVNPTIVQDAQCTPIRLISQTSRTSAKTYSTRPWCFAPLLQTNDESPITTHLSPVKSELVSNITLLNDNNVQVTKLLSTSNESHVMNAPEAIKLKYAGMSMTEDYFNQPSQTAAVLLEGCFRSAFTGKTIPDSCKNLSSGRINMGKPARQIIVSTASIIQNEWNNAGGQSQPIPLGYDQLTEQQYGNADFIVNAVKYLAGDGNLLRLRSRTYKLKTLDKKETEGNALIKWQIINVACPLLIIFLIVIGFRSKKQA